MRISRGTVSVLIGRERGNDRCAGRPDLDDMRPIRHEIKFCLRFADLPGLYFSDKVGNAFVGKRMVEHHQPQWHYNVQVLTYELMRQNSQSTRLGLSFETFYSHRRN
eukprot:5636770-Pleurochrysis_carterae.AAC.1